MGCMVDDILGKSRIGSSLYTCIMRLVVMSIVLAAVAFITRRSRHRAVVRRRSVRMPRSCNVGFELYFLHPQLKRQNLSGSLTGSP
jgi:hypothetical protein